MGTPGTGRKPPGRHYLLAEQALALDPNDPRVQYTPGFMCCSCVSSTARSITWTLPGA